MGRVMGGTNRKRTAISVFFSHWLEFDCVTSHRYKNDGAATGTRPLRSQHTTKAPATFGAVLVFSHAESTTINLVASSNYTHSHPYTPHFQLYHANCLTRQLPTVV